MADWLRVALDCLLPRCCEACDAGLPAGHETCLCATCMVAVATPVHVGCDVCGVPTVSTAPRCIDCLRMPPAFSTARALGLYLPATAGLNPLARAVHALKYRRRRVVATTLGVMLARCYPFAPDAVLVPVPLHPAKLRVRGFNQALLLARVVARHRGLRIAPHALQRGRPTAGQFRLGAVARRENLRDAFTVRRPDDVRARAVVVVDDVMTTGATADACARALLGTGARRVDVLTVGRTPSPGSDSVESFGTRC